MFNFLEIYIDTGLYDTSKQYPIQIVLPNKIVV